MDAKIQVPEIQDDSSEAKLTHWLKKIGDAVVQHEEIAQVETEKALIEVLSPATGTLTAISIAEGSPVKAGEAIGTIAITASPKQIPQSHVTQNPDSTFDLIVIGSGPGGYVCAIRAAQLGLKVAVVEKRATYGGTCLNVGCIPSKALLYASEMLAEAERSFSRLGIQTNNLTVDLATMMKHKSTTVDTTVKGVAYLFKKNRISTYHGTASFISSSSVKVAQEDGSSQTLTAKNIVIATGSSAAQLHGISMEGDRIVSSDGAIAFNSTPKQLLVVGAGAIGLELGSVWRRLGSQVTIVEYLDHILPGIDTELSTYCQSSFARQGLEFRLNTKLESIDSSADLLKAVLKSRDGSSSETISADKILIATGRVPYTAGLNLEGIGVAFDERGRIKTDSSYRTNVSGVWAIGDVIEGPMLAHKASAEGVAAAENICGLKSTVNYGAIPAVVYTSPEVASVGKTEDELRTENAAYEVGKFPFSANARARAMLCTEGFVKVLADASTKRILGAHIVGASAGELISELSEAIANGASIEQVVATCHAHPTLSESIKEAALGVLKRQINI